MKNKIKILLTLLLLLPLSLIFFKLNTMNDSELRARIDRNIDPVIEEIEKKYPIHCKGGTIKDGLYYQRKKLCEISISFVAYHQSSIQEAREIVVQIIQKITDLINKDKKLRPYLDTFPFPYEKVYISLYFRQPDNNYYPDLAHVTSYAGIHYNSFDSRTSDLKSIYSESFEEAQKIIQNKSKINK
ncbi:MAG TPA: hypothetical protein VLG49_05935 [Rhabdochlamydiaceae bacterium]|nr:hypothetical protein [Rhabdochlamydiaceae bacterium]